jgi:hypothetical protein
MTAAKIGRVMKKRERRMVSSVQSLLHGRHEDRPLLKYGR